MECPKCKGDMEKGVLADEGMWGAWLVRRLRWAESVGILGLLAKNLKPIEAYRCQKCGYLENYAK